MAEIRKLNPNILFSVLLDQNNVKLLLEWIDFSYGDNDDEKSDTTTGIFSSKITQTMVDYLDSNQRVFPDTKDILLNQLAKFKLVYRLINYLKSSFILLFFVEGIIFCLPMRLAI